MSNFKQILENSESLNERIASKEVEFLEQVKEYILSYTKCFYQYTTRFAKIRVLFPEKANNMLKKM